MTVFISPSRTLVDNAGVIVNPKEEMKDFRFCDYWSYQKRVCRSMAKVYNIVFR
ncbi:hypothetical protein YC2023_055223 [Brassica napus]